MSRNNVSWKLCLLGAMAIGLSVFLIFFLFVDKFQTQNGKTEKERFVQELADLKFIHMNEEADDYYTENVKTSTALFEDKYVKIRLEQYNLYDDLVLAKFKVEQISDEELIVFSGDEWNLKKNVTFDDGNCIKINGGYKISLRNQRDEYYNFINETDSIKKTDDGLEIYMRTYIFEENNGFKYVVSNGEKDAEFPLELTETTGLAIRSENSRLILKPHLLYTYDEPDFDKVEIEYSDGVRETIVKDRTVYTTWFSDEKNIWLYVVNGKRVKTENIKKVYLDETSYVYDKEQNIYVKE